MALPAVFTVVAGALVALVAAGALGLSVAGTLRAAKGSRAPVTPPADAPHPFATVIVPCKGFHHGLAENARALAAQHYPRYELLFVLDDRDDPSWDTLERVAKEVPHARVMLSDPSEGNVGAGWATGKIVAQLHGVTQSDPRSEVLVFADADARPSPEWLASLVSPLADERVGGVTGYRWYHAASRPTAWTTLRDAWNAVGLDAMTMPRLRFLWGGSMAVRRRDFERAPIGEEWRSHVSEDVGLTRAMQRLGLGIAFAPGAIVASPEDWTRTEVLEWMVRQAALTRASMPNVFRFAAAVYAIALGLFVVGLALALAAPTPWLAVAGWAMTAPLLTAVPRAWLRERLARRALPGLASQPRSERAASLLWSLAMPAIMLGVLAKARAADAIHWRGRRYVLVDSDKA